MADEDRIFNNDFELEVFALVTGCFSVLAVVIITMVVMHLSSSINKLKKEVGLERSMELQSFHNPTIQPNEELAKRGFSMYKGQQDVRAPSTPETELHFGDFSPQPHQKVHRY